MGVLNANEDSFFSQSRFKDYEACQKIENMISQGANIIDIGAVSSRPGSVYCGEEEELRRVKNIADIIYKNNYYEKVDFSIDSYSPLVCDYVLNKGFTIVNDITGLEDDELCKVASSYKAQVVIMHMQNNPQNMQDNPFYEDVIRQIDEYFSKQITKAKHYGISDIVLDVGIGFGKTLEHNISLIQNLAYFKKHNYPLLIGASRKSMIEHILQSPCPVKDRLAGTIAIHLQAIKEGASIIRCHDVKEHHQAIKVFENLQKKEKK